MADQQQTAALTPEQALQKALAARQAQQEPAAGEQSPVSVEVSGDPGLLEQIGGYAKDLGIGVVGGIRDGLQETGETLQWAAEGVGNAVTQGHDVYWSDDNGLEWLTAEEVRGRSDIADWQKNDLIGETLSLPEVSENETTAGGMTRGVAQFLTGFGIAGKALKGVKAATTAGAAVKAAGQGAVADFASFDAHEARFSNFLRDNAGFADPITEYLAADEDDIVLEGKLKNSLEGLGMGVATDAVVRLAKAFKGARKVKATDGAEAAAEQMNEAVEQIGEEQLSLFDEMTDPNLRADDAAAGPRKVVVEGGSADPAAQATEAAKERAFRKAEGVPLRDKPRPAVDVSGLQDRITEEMRLYENGVTPDPNRSLEGSLFNFEYMDADIDTKGMLEMASQAVPESLLKNRTTFDKINREASRFLADSVDVSPEVIDASLANMAQGMKNQQGIVIAGKQLVLSLSREIDTLAHKISIGKAEDADYSRMVNLQSRVIEVSGNLKSVITGAAQTTSAGRIRTTDAVTGQELARADILKQLEDGLDAAGGRDAIRDLADEIVAAKKAGQGTAGIMRVTANRKAKGFWAVTNEVRINGLLSGPKTHVINMLSNSLQTGLLPIEKMVGGAVSGNRAAVVEGFDQLMGIGIALKDSTKAAAMAFKTGRNILDPEAAILEANGVNYNAIRSESDNAVVRNLVNGLGSVIRFPSRGLLTGDELFKQINYRSQLYARLNRQAGELVRSGKITSKEAGKWVADRMETGFAKDGQATDLRSLEHAREATFTNDLRKGSLMKGIQDGTNKHPWLKTILPFVRTPTNIVVAAGQRTPILQFTSKNLMDDLRSGDVSRVASARGKIAVGGALWGSAVYGALNGDFTGGGPVDPQARKLLMETGWQPYSLVIKDAEGNPSRYISYQRLDPFAMFFGIAADVAEISGEIGEEETKKIAVASLAAVANNVASKTWLQGITDAVDAFNNPEMRGESYLSSLATSFLPYSSLSREARKASDDVVRDTSGDPDAAFWELQSLVNAAKNMAPGYSKTLPAKRSWITGEPLLYPKGVGSNMVTPLGDIMASAMPINGSKPKKNPVLDELARLSFAFSPPTRKMLGVEMTPQQYGELLELHGTVRSPSTRRTMLQELERVMMSQSYDLKRSRAPDFSEPELDPRVKVVRKVISAYRKLASDELLKRHPDLYDKVAERKYTAQRNARSMATGINAIRELGQ